ncbi:hypothetical protein FXV83_08295 [Bradyrhizobium hipponense]|uniref:Uncharacterized protein n=1 Tax=Bradyrhizobium hipponense TaxID=2605638 RepID=A0A5S4YXD3_9BRAD|nr:hypothetical protein [Bradyrhizobium hipponense]TYO67179.1 hypothetical protein FXV83_08295 [Bradyrhizobium hipponense]
MYKDALFDELRQIEREVVEGERQLAVQEARVIEMKKQRQDITTAQAELEMMRCNQRRREQDRQRLLCLLQP